MRGICVLLVLLMPLLTCCQSRDLKEERAYRAARARGDILVGVAAPWNDTRVREMYLPGVELAVEEVNGKGGVLKRKIRILYRDDGGTVDTGRVVAQNFCNNPDVVAVLGHFYSIVSVPVSFIYEYHGLLMLSPISTAPDLTGHDGMKLIFRNIPSDEVMAQQLAQFAYASNYLRTVIYFEASTYGRGLTKAFIKHFERIGGTVVDSLSYDMNSGGRYFRRDLSWWKDNLTFDAVFVAGSATKAAELISEARRLGIDVPVFGGDDLLSPELWEIGGSSVEGTIVGAVFDATDPRPEVRSFCEAFRRKYGYEPEDDAAQGYDALKLLASSMEKAGTTVPLNVADALRSTENWIGVTGPHTFNERGDVVGKPVVIKVLRNKRFELLEWANGFREIPRG